MRITILSAVFCLFIQISLSSQETPAFELKDTMWQFMPDDVIAVYRGPDNRIWQRLQDNPPGKSIDELKKNIQDEFTRKSPRIYCRILLFEPGKRVWFTNRDSNILLGYDGEKWTEKKAEERNYFFGEPPELMRKGKNSNLFVDGRSFFIESAGILSFDGKDWIFNEMGNPNLRGPLPPFPLLLPSYDKKGVIAISKSKNRGAAMRRMPANNPIAIQRDISLASSGIYTGEFNAVEFRDGKWNKINLIDDFNPADVEIILPRKTGLIVAQTNGKILFLQDEIPDKEKFFSLLKKLSDNNFNIREKATSEIAGLSPSYRKAIDDARREAKDPEVRDRLEKALKLMKEGSSNTDTKDSFQLLGDYNVKEPTLVHYDTLGRVFLTSQEVRSNGKDESLGPGLIILDSEDKLAFLKGEKFTQGWGVSNSDFINIQSRPDGAINPLPSIFWLETKDVIRILDIDKKDFIHETKDVSFHWLHAATPGGTFFCSRSMPSNISLAKPIALFKPSAKDERLKLSIQEIKIHAPYFLITADDSLWLKNPEGEVMMFNGKEWKSIPELNDIQVTNVKTGNDGAFISIPSSSNQLPLSFMYAEGKVTVEKNQDILVSKNRGTIEKYFDEKNKDFLYDGAGRIWYQKSQNELMISSVTRTFNLYDKLQETYSKGQVRTFMGISKNKVLIDYYSWGHGGPGNTITLACQFKDGVPELKEIPRMSRSRSDPVYDNEGKLWYPLETAPDEKQVAIRIGEEEKTEEIKESGSPILCDKTGNVWLGNITGQQKNKFNIWRKGEVKASVEIPHANEWTTLDSDKEGSVIAFTGPLVSHLVAEDPANPAAYKVKAEYWIDVKGYPGKPNGFKLGDKFYLGACSWIDKDYYLNLIEFPPSEKK